MVRGLIVWAVIMGAETIHGILRSLFLVPLAGQALSDRIGWPVAIVLVIGLSCALAPWLGLRQRHDLLRLGLVWAALSFLFEIGIGLLRGLDGAAIWAEINPLSGGLMLYSLVIMGLAPLIAARLRRLHASSPK